MKTVLLYRSFPTITCSDMQDGYRDSPRVALPDPDQAPELLGERRHLQLGIVIIVLLRSCNTGFVVAKEKGPVHVGVGMHSQDRRSMVCAERRQTVAPIIQKEVGLP